MVTASDVDLFPAASRATAVSWCVPFAAPIVFHGIEYGAVVSSVPRGLPSNLNCTPTTPTASDASAAMVNDPTTVALSAGAVSEATGGTVSAFRTLKVTAVAVVEFPAASRATAVSRCEPSATEAEFQEME